MILQQMQMLDQQVAAPLAVAEQCLNLGERCRIDLSAFGMIGPAPAPRARMDATVVSYCHGAASLACPSPSRCAGPSLSPRAGRGRG